MREICGHDYFNSGCLICVRRRIMDLSTENFRYKKALEDINKVLSVPAAEYVPAIRDAFVILDEVFDGSRDVWRVKP